MFIQLPKPYPDELLYSVIARYFKHFGISRHSYVIHQMFGQRFRPTVDLPFCLDKVADLTHITWELTGEEILERLTLFPFYARYLPTTRRNRCANDFIGGPHSGSRGRLGLCSSLIKAKKHLYYCAQCAKSDMLQFGETYWRRVHQIPGVLVCNTHASTLIQGAAFRSKATMISFIDATEYYESDDGRLPTLSLNSWEQKLALIVSKKCEEKLNAPFPISQEDQSIYLSYRTCLSELGWLVGDRLRCFEDFVQEFSSFYTSPLLSYLEIKVKYAVHNNWLQRIVSRGNNSLHPLMHVLVETFFENSKPSTDPPTHVHFGNGPWLCQNRYAPHYGTHPIEKIEIWRKSGNWVAYATCSCGFKFSFREVSDADPCMPVGLRVCQYGPLWPAEMRRLRAAGLSIRRIAAKMGVNWTTVNRLLNTGDEKPSKPRRDKKSPNAKKWRRIFTTYHSKSPDEKAILRSQYKVAYSSLRAYDPGWLRKQIISRGKKTGASKAGWDARDKEWESVIRKNIEQIRDETPLRRLTKNRILNACGLHRVRYQIHCLPKVARLLEQCTETITEFRVRKLYFSAEKIRESGLPITRRRLLRYIRSNPEYAIGIEIESAIANILSNKQ